ncbi:MAG: hypothetical protein GU357_05895 [Thermofilum sp.]|jgi:hypothetical protein|nr:hypothetical protein [Thermofilum sp.]
MSEPSVAVVLRITDENYSESKVQLLRELAKNSIAVQLHTDWPIIESLGVGDILDPLLDEGIEVMSVNVPMNGSIDSFTLEKLVMIAEESTGKTVIFREPLNHTYQDLKRIVDMCITYKVRALLEPQSKRQAMRQYSYIKRLIGGALGFSHVEEHYATTEEMLESALRFLGLTHNITITNYDELNAPAPLLTPKRYNNPLLIRTLLEKGFDGSITVQYNPDLVDTPTLLKEVLALKEFIKNTYERIQI